MFFESTFDEAMAVVKAVCDLLAKEVAEEPLQPGENFIIVSQRENPEYYFQAAFGRGKNIQCEVTGDEWIPKEIALKTQQKAALKSLGWKLAETDNHTQSWKLDAKTFQELGAKVAQLIDASLIGAYGCNRQDDWTVAVALEFQSELSKRPKPAHEIEEVAPGRYLLNRGSENRITVTCQSIEIAKELRATLTAPRVVPVNGERREQLLYSDQTAYIATHAIGCFEVQRYTQFMGDLYQTVKKRLIKLHESKADKPLDLMQLALVTRETASALAINARFIPFMENPAHAVPPKPQKFWTQYDSQALRFYLLRHEEKLGKVWIVPKSGAFYDVALRCIKTGLAITGSAISLERRLADYPLAKLNLAMPQKLSRKADIIAKLIAMPDAETLAEAVFGTDLCVEFVVPFSTGAASAYLDAWAYAETLHVILSGAFSQNAHSVSSWSYRRFPVLMPSGEVIVRRLNSARDAQSPKGPKLELYDFVSA